MKTAKPRRSAADRRILAAVKDLEACCAAVREFRTVGRDDISPRIERASAAAERAETAARTRLTKILIDPDTEPADGSPVVVYRDPQGVVVDDALYLTYALTDDFYRPGETMLFHGFMSVLAVPMDRITRL